MLGELKIEPISVEGNCICFIDTGLNEEKVRTQFYPFESKADRKKSYSLHFIAINFPKIS